MGFTSDVGESSWVSIRQQSPLTQCFGTTASSPSSRQGTGIYEEVNLKAIAPVDNPTDWVGSMVIVREPGKLRVCFDFMDLNEVVMREHSHIPTPEEIFAKLVNTKFI